MWSMFSVPVGRVCREFGCELNGQEISQLHDRNCSACGHELALLTKTDRLAVGVAIGAAVVLLVTLGFGAYAWQRHRAEAREAELLARGNQRLKEELVGAKAAEAPAILDGLQQELQLTDEQRERLLTEAEPLIALLPRALDKRLGQRIELLLRDDFARNASFTPEVANLVASLVASERLDKAEATAFVTQAQKRIADSALSLRLGMEAIGDDPAAAAEEFRRATESDPGNSWAWSNLGAAEMLLGRSEKARNCYRRALELDPGNGMAHFNLGAAAARAGKRSEAIKHLKTALEVLGADDETQREAMIRDLEESRDFDALRRDQRFSELLSASRQAMARGES